MRLVRRLVVLAGAVILSVAVASTANAAGVDSARSYRPIELGTLGGGFSTATSLNDFDDVVGSSQLAQGPGFHAFLWHRGRMTDLGTLPGGAFSGASDINDRGQIVGQSTTATGVGHAVLWQHGTVSDLGTLGGPDSTAVAVNDRGQVVGTSSTAGGQLHGFLWCNGMLTDLGDFLPVDVNDRGQIAGYTSRIGAQAASFRWQDGTLTDVGSLAAYTYAAAIDLYGTVVGRAGKVSIAGVSDVGFVWRHGTFTELGTDGGVHNPTAVSLNDVGQVVGYAQTTADPVQFHPLRWQHGTVVDLTTVGVLPGIVWKVNNRGHLAGIRTTQGGPPLQPHAVLYV